MANLRRINVAWSGITALPGVSVFYAPFGTDAGANLNTFFGAIKGQFPASLSWNIPTSGDVIQDSDGAVTGAWTGGTGGSVVSTGTGVYPAGTGAYINWQTGTIVGRRRLKGRTFLAPLLSAAFDNSGTIATSTLSSMQAAATALAASGALVIWHRPTSIGAADGSSGAVTAGLIPDQVTSLRTRRF